MIRFEGMRYRYPDTSSDALREIDLEVHDGELLIVAGESGAGKSTLLRAMNGLVPHFHGGIFGGSVKVDGISTLDIKPRDLADKIGFVGQDPEDHSVVDRVESDIAFTLENLGVDSKTMRKRVEEVFDALSIAHLRSRRLQTLSGGERQRVAIAGALVSMPRHIVLDEPTSQLDPQSSEEVIAAILRLRDEMGLGIVLAEHRLERVIQYAETMCYVDTDGVLVGSPRDICASIDAGPPIVRLAKALGWSPLPLTLREARNFASDAPGRAYGAGSRGRHAIPGDVLVRVCGLSMRLGGATVLTDIDIEARQGEVIALMGRNGSGKTSLLRAICGLVAKVPAVIETKGTLAYVPQDPEAILFRPTVAEEIRATLKGRGIHASDLYVHQEAERFGVSGFIDRYPRDLSGGQRTKAALAAAASGGPDIILLDEPTRGMDEPSKLH
ncbi:MAG: ATP-binding cassette domain-containing protein, partial [Actinobacteria bacterium]|nr:ATP-binding cassette domain-containing protein [Actinomycetota bacterium]